MLHSRGLSRSSGLAETADSPCVSRDRILTQVPTENQSNACVI